MDDILEKLKQIQSLISECISSQSGEESDEGEEETSEGEGTSESLGGDNAGDKIKMASAMLKKRMSM